MGFKDLQGQELAKKLLLQGIKTHRIAHAYLFHGPSGVGKRKAALAFAQALLCEGEEADPCGQCLSCLWVQSGHHPDLTLLVAEGNSLKIEQVRQWQQEQAYQPYRGQWKISIVDDGDKMTAQAANSLLKILEEPGPGTVIIVLTNSITEVLPTIVSRCQTVRFNSLSVQEIQNLLQQHCPQLTVDEVNLTSRLCRGSMENALRLASQEDLEGYYKKCKELVNRLTDAPHFQLLQFAEELEQLGENLNDGLTLLMMILRDRMVWGATGDKGLLWDKDATDWEQGSKQCLAWHMKGLQLIKQTQTVLKQNANTRLALEVMFLQLGKTNDIR